MVDIIDRLAGVKVTALLLAFFIILSIAPVPATAHMPGADPPPEFELDAILVMDGGTELEISMDDVGNYHNEQAKKMKRSNYKKQGKTDAEIDTLIAEEFEGTDGKCPCVSCAFRAALLGISNVWGDEKPKRDDIKIISHVSTPGSCQCFQYITGTGLDIVPAPGTKGMFQIIFDNGTEVTNKSMSNVKKNGVNTKSSDWHFTIHKISTGDSYEADVNDDVFPNDFFDLRKKVKHGKPQNATQEEMDRFTSEWEEVRDSFLTEPNWVLFEGVEEPEEDITSGLVFLSILVVCGVMAAVWYAMKKRRSP